MPEKLEALQTEIKALEYILGDTDFYQKDPEAFNKAAMRLPLAQQELAQSEERYLELIDMIEG
jgi:ABC transporter C-terminal domain